MTTSPSGYLEWLLALTLYRIYTLPQFVRLYCIVQCLYLSDQEGEHSSVSGLISSTWRLLSLIHLSDYLGTQYIPLLLRMLRWSLRSM